MPVFGAAAATAAAVMPASICCGRGHPIAMEHAALQQHCQLVRPDGCARVCICARKRILLRPCTCIACKAVIAASSKQLAGMIRVPGSACCVYWRLSLAARSRRFGCVLCRLMQFACKSEAHWTAQLCMLVSFCCYWPTRVVSVWLDCLQGS